MVSASDTVKHMTRGNEVNVNVPPDRPVKRWTRAYARKLVFSDLVVLLWTFFAAHVFWANRPDWSQSEEPYSLQWVLVSLILISVWHLALTVSDTRDPRVVGAGPYEYKRIVNSTVSTFAFIAFIGYIFQVTAPRSYVLVAVPLGTVLLVLSRWSWRQWLLVSRQNGRMTTSVVAVGSENSMRELIHNLHSAAHTGYRIVGVCPTSPSVWSSIDGIPILGNVSDVVKCTHDIGATVIMVAASDAAYPEMVRRLGWELEGYDIDMIVAPALANIAGPRVHVRPVAGLPLLHVERPAYQGTQRWAKALFDRFGSLALIIAASPIILAAAIAIKASSRGSVFFAQERAGRDGESFRMVKFRTMVKGADKMLGELEIQADAGNEFMFKVKDDPRVTKVGKFLRRYSIDELPQLFNVLRADMSLVGPRPPLQSEVAGYEQDAHRRLLVKPGITGLWQISGRSDLNWEDTVRLDLYYVENWSIVGDLVILWRTARAVLGSRGAY